MRKIAFVMLIAGVLMLAVVSVVIVSAFIGQTSKGAVIIGGADAPTYMYIVKVLFDNGIFAIIMIPVVLIAVGIFLIIAKGSNI